MDQDQLHPRSHLFTVRLWAENIREGQSEWRGRVQYVTSGEANYFRDWSTLITHLLQMLPQAKAGAVHKTCPLFGKKNPIGVFIDVGKNPTLRATFPVASSQGNQTKS